MSQGTRLKDQSAQQLEAQSAQQLEAQPAQQLEAQPAQQLEAQPAQQLEAQPAQQLETQSSDAGGGDPHGSDAAAQVEKKEPPATAPAHTGNTSVVFKVTTGEPAVPSKPRRADLAFLRVLAQLRAQPEATLVLINFDIPSLVPTLLEAAQKIENLRPLFLQVHPLDMRLVDEFEDLVLALAHTHSVVRVSEETFDGEDVPFLIDRRAHLYRTAEYAVDSGLLDAAKLQKIKLTGAHDEVAYDVMALSHLFLQSWDNLEGRIALRREELETLRDKANNLLLTSVAKDDKPVSLVEATLDRRRAATKVLGAHRKLRIALALLLETQKEVDALLPELKMRTRSKPTTSSPAVENNGVSLDEFKGDANGDDDVNELEEAGANAEAQQEPAPRNSMFTTKTDTPTKAAVGIGLPGSSPVDEED